MEDTTSIAGGQHSVPDAPSARGKQIGDLYLPRDHRLRFKALLVFRSFILYGFPLRHRSIGPHP